MACRYRRYFLGWTLHHEPSLDLIKVDSQGEKLSDLLENASLHTVDRRDKLGPIFKHDQIHLVDYMILKSHLIDFLNYELFGAKVNKYEYDKL